MKKQGKTSKLQQENIKLRELAADVLYTADRVSKKFGHDDEGTPSDYTEWWDLRQSLERMRLALK